MTNYLTRDQLEGREVYASDGEKLGKVEDIYYDGDSDQGEWIGVKAGFLGMKRMLVPTHGATVQGDDVVLAYTKQQLQDAPDIDENTFASDEDERTAYGYYGVDYPGRSFGYAGTDEYQRPDVETDSVVRHEEEVSVGTREVSAGSVRLRKWVETKPVTEDVTLERETAEVVREPINQTVSGDRIGEQEIRVDLTAEEAVVEKQTVAKERVSLDKDVEHDVERVSETVREEHVEMDRDATSSYR
ncbi:MAG: hypothetical protein JWM86_1010 [Thermoleophilia bacterium]|nr:hypothetical protein [Thermoleophilia bacterium]